MQNYEVLKEISDVIEVRKQAAAESSYVSQLMHKGEDAILKKVIEEAGAVSVAYTHLTPPTIHLVYIHA